MTTEVVTVVTVAFNAKEDLEKTIKSVRDQSYEKIEYIIIDGGSEDGTVELITQYADSVTYWVSEPDEGIYHAMNKAIDAASGAWINFMNAGDTFADTDVVEHFVRLAQPDSDICYGSRYVQEGDKRVLDKAAELESFYYDMPFGHQAAFVRCTVLRQYRFDLSYTLSADYDFFIRCYRDGCRFQNLDFPVCVFQAGGLSTTMRLKSLLETLKLLTDYVDEETVKQSAFYSRMLKKLILGDETAMSARLEQEHERMLELWDAVGSLTSLKAATSPLKKYRAYKKMMQTYHRVKK